MAEENKFKESQERFKKWRNENSDIIGLCNWQITHDRFQLECWTHRTKGLVIIQIWENGDGFHEYYLNEEKRTNKKIDSLKVGSTYLVHEDDNDEWAKCKVTSIDSKNKIAELLQLDGEDEGLDFEITEEEINDSEYFNPKVL